MNAIGFLRRISVLVYRIHISASPMDKACAEHALMWHFHTLEIKP